MLLVVVMLSDNKHPAPIVIEDGMESYPITFDIRYLTTRVYRKKSEKRGKCNK